MLALPILTGLSGFFPSLIAFLSVWLFMTLTGLLMVEVNGWFKEKKVNIVSMAGKTLGRPGKVLGWGLYVFLFYSLLVAYISGSSSLFSFFIEQTLSFHVPQWVCSFFFVFLFGWVVYLGTRPVDLWNRVLMVGKIFAYFSMVFLGVKYIAPRMLLRTDNSYTILSLPVLVTAFGFHNMVPVLTSYMKGDLKRVRITILGGSAFALIIYVIWQLLVLGTVPLLGENGIIDSYTHGREAAQALAGVLRSSAVGFWAQTLAFFAMLTSFLAQALALVHFLADGLKVTHHRRENVGLCALALLPPLFVTLIYPQLFFSALSFAGGICAVFLFGILPAVMVWIGRYHQEIDSSYQVKGGKCLLAAIFLFGLLIMFVQVSGMAGASYLPKV